MSNNFNDDDIDEVYEESTQKITQIESAPLPLTEEEVKQVQSILSSKSLKEHLDYLAKLMSAHDSNLNDMQVIQIETNVKKNFGDKSKRELNKIIFSFINQQNKHVFLQKKEEPVKEEKLSREELRNKLHNKMKMNNKNNLKEMYEKLQEEMEKANLDGDGVEEVATGEENGANTDKKKKKKKKKLDLSKLDPKQLQNQFINQMASYMKNTPFGGSV